MSSFIPPHQKRDRAAVLADLQAKRVEQRLRQAETPTRTVVVDVGRSADSGSVWLDDVEISPLVRGISVRSAVGELTEVRLDVLPSASEIRAVLPEAQIHVATRISEAEMTTNLKRWRDRPDVTISDEAWRDLLDVILDVFK